MLTLIFSLIFPSFSLADNPNVECTMPEVHPNKIIVRFKKGFSKKQSRLILGVGKYELDQAITKDLDLYIVSLKKNLHPTLALDELEKNPFVQYAQYDHYVKLRVRTPNDKNFNKQWSLNPSQSSHHISATQAWGLTTGGKDKGGNDLVRCCC